MKKSLVIIGLTLATASSLLAGATAQVTLSATYMNTYFYEDAGKTDPVNTGYYLEVILSQDNVYNTSEYLTATIIGTGFGTLSGTHAMGYTSSGVAVGDGKASITWTFSTTTYDNYYASFRFYNHADKAQATKYGVLGFKQITVDPVNEGDSPAVQYLSYNEANESGYTQYAIPEPATMTLIGLGGLAMVLRRKMRKTA